MNIYYLSTSEIPSRTANSIHVMKMCQALARNGHHVKLFAKQGEPEDAGTDDFGQYGVASCFDIIKCRRPRVKKLLGDFQYGLDVARLVRRMPRPDLFFARHIYSLAGVSSLAVPMMYEAHTPPVNILQRMVEGRVFRRPSFLRLIVISQALRHEYQRQSPWLSGARIRVARDAADPPDGATVLPVAANWPGRSGAFQVGYTGHLYRGRGIGLIFSLANRLPDVDFHLVGGMEKDIARWKRAGAPGNLFFHGFVGQPLLPWYFSHFDVVLAPYQEQVMSVGGKKEIARWMSPMKIFEYMAAGKAIVCSDHPVLREVLTHRVNCWLAPPADVDAWCRA